MFSVMDLHNKKLDIVVSSNISIVHLYINKTENVELSECVIVVYRQVNICGYISMR